MPRNRRKRTLRKLFKEKQEKVNHAVLQGRHDMEVQEKDLKAQFKEKWEEDHRI